MALADRLIKTGTAKDSLGDLQQVKDDSLAAGRIINHMVLTRQIKGSFNLPAAGQDN
jgi:hypothetical protein